MTRNRGDAESTAGYANTAAASLVRAKDSSGFIKWYLLAFLFFPLMFWVFLTLCY